MPERTVLAAAALAALLAVPQAAAGGIGAERAAALEHLVLQDCGACHGIRLSGGLGPDIRAAALEGLPAISVAQIILDGVPGTAMPPWRPLLTEEEARWIAEYLKSAGE